MSTINHEPTLGAPQSQAGAEMLNHPGGIPGVPPLAGIPGQVQQMPTQQAPTQQFSPEQIAQIQAQQQANVVAQQQAQQAHYNAQMAAQQQAPVTPPLNVPGQAPAQQLPVIQDNAPVAELPAATVQQLQQAPAAQPIQEQQAPAGYPGMAGIPGGYNPAMAQQQAPQYNPAMAQQQAPVGYNPAMAQQQAPQYNPAMAQQQAPQYNPAAQQQYAPQYGQQQAPGASNQSYLQQQGGMFGPTPTGHPEKTKFQGQAILVHVTNRVTKKNTLMTTGLFNPKPGDRNSAANSFVCFSGSAANQIEILNNPAIKAQYTQLPQAKGQIINFEGSWEWDDRAKTPGWKCMMDNFVFVSDPNLRMHAESFVPPVPPSPMDMLNGGNMNMGAMMQQQPQYNPAMQNPAAQGYPGMAQPQYNPAAQQQAPIGGQYNPYQQAGVPQYNPAAPQGQQFPGTYPGMPGHQ